MSTADKNDPARAWLVAEELLAEEDDERLASLSPEERQAEFERRGVKPATEWNARDMIAAAKARAARQAATTAPLTPPAPSAPPQPAPPQKIAPVIPIRKTWRNVALLVAAACVGFLVLLVIQSPPNNVAHPPPQSNREIAEADRDMAEVSCASREWAACKDRLDQAARLDPDGESEPRVQKARAEIAVALGGHRVDAGGIEKPGP